MKKATIGAILLLLIGGLAVVAWYFAAPLLKEREELATSDARDTKGTIRGAVDSWVGYFPLRSPEMKKRMQHRGWAMKLTDDGADYSKRMQALARGDIDIAVVTVDSYMLNAAKYDFPGVIIFVIDESSGGDAIVARSEAVSRLEDIKGKTPKIAFTPNSPSHHLLKAMVDHFNLPELLPRGELRLESNGSEEALKKLRSGEAQVAVLWEPDVSRALAIPGVKKLLGTENTSRLIVDILVVRRDYAKEHPEAIKDLVHAYFQTLKVYRDDPAKLQADLKEETKLPDDAIAVMLKGVRWVNLTENCQKWFGISSPGIMAERLLVDTIESTDRILQNAGDFQKSPLPNEDPYRLVYSEFLKEEFLTGEAGFTIPGAQDQTVVQGNSLENKFAALNDEQWGKVTDVVALKIDPIVFQSGTAMLSVDGKEGLDAVVEKIKHYPNFRILVRGHTSVEGDAEANKALSQERADAVATYLKVTYSIDENRIRATGFGGEKPLPRAVDESDRAWYFRLSRVEVVLGREEI